MEERKIMQNYMKGIFAAAILTAGFALLVPGCQKKDGAGASKQARLRWGL
jgi:hypothetical protein